MRKLGIALVVVGFVAGALACTWTPTAVVWPLFAFGLAAGVAGVVLLRVSHKRVVGMDQAHENLRQIREALSRVAQTVAQLDREKDRIDTYDLPARIDESFRDDLEVFVDGRRSIVTAYGVDAYAEVMTEFAAAERYLNRVWSASIDGYEDEAHRYIKKAADQFDNAVQSLKRFG